MLVGILFALPLLVLYSVCTAFLVKALNKGAFSTRAIVMSFVVTIIAFVFQMFTDSILPWFVTVLPGIVLTIGSLIPLFSKRA